MARYQMSDGMVVDTSKASESWKEGRRFDGNNHISLATGSQWDHQVLYRSRRGRYYIESWSQWQGSTPSAEWVSHEDACRWLLANEYDDLPDDLQQAADKVTE